MSEYSRVSCENCGARMTSESGCENTCSSTCSTELKQKRLAEAGLAECDDCGEAVQQEEMKYGRCHECHGWHCFEHGINPNG